MSYTLEDYQKIYDSNPEKFELNQYYDKIIQDLCDNLNILFNKALIRKTFKKKKKLENEDWDIIRNFKLTEFNKNSKENINLQNCRKYLNMLIDSNFDYLSEKIIYEIKQVLDNKTINDYNNICENVFNLICNNTLYSNIYSKLLTNLMKEFDSFSKILNESINNFEKKIINIKYVDPDDNYNKFCENNKINEEIRALCSLYGNLVKDSVIDYEKILKINIFLIDQLEKNINLYNLKKEVEEISELIYILTTLSYYKYDSNNKDLINNKINKICLLKNGDASSITSKTIFKFMDIKDECKIN